MRRTRTVIEPYTRDEYFYWDKNTYLNAPGLRFPTARFPASNVNGHLSLYLVALAIPLIMLAVLFATANVFVGAALLLLAIVGVTVVVSSSYDTDMQGFYLHQKSLGRSDVGNHLRDEFVTVVAACAQFKKAIDLAPEGDSVATEYQEFLLMCDHYIDTLLELSPALAASENLNRATPLWEAYSHLQKQAKDIKAAGANLGDTVTSARAIHVMDRASAIGVDEFNELASHRTAAFRQLMPAEGD